MFLRFFQQFLKVIVGLFQGALLLTPIIMYFTLNIAYIDLTLVYVGITLNVFSAPIIKNMFSHLQHTIDPLVVDAISHSNLFIYSCGAVILWGLFILDLGDADVSLWVGLIMFASFVAVLIALVGNEWFIDINAYIGENYLPWAVPSNTVMAPITYFRAGISAVFLLLLFLKSEALT